MNQPVSQYRVFDPADPPEWLDSRWWIETPNCNHLDNRVHQARLQAAASAAVRWAEIEQTVSIVDLGAGDGGLLSLLPEEYRLWSYGYEIIKDSVQYANFVRDVLVLEANVLTDKLDLGKVVVATEMLEHLEDPYTFVRRLYEDTRINVLVASSPHSETVQHHEWNHAWAWDRQGYSDLISQSGFRIAEHFDAEWSQVVVGIR